MDNFAKQNKHMIQTKEDLHFYIAADRIMNGLPPKRQLKDFFWGGGNNQLFTSDAVLCVLPEYSKKDVFY